MPKVANLHDQPIKTDADDMLEFESLARIIANRLLLDDASQTDTVGLYGPWGSGKTGVIKLVQDKCKEKATWIDFDALRYQSAGDVVIPLLYRVAESAPKDKLPLIKGVLKSLWKAAKAFAVSSVPGGKYVEQAADGVADAAASFIEGDETSLPPSPSNVIESQFRRLIELIRGNSTKPVIIAIDNLDRCSPPAVLKVIEAIHLVLNVPGAVYLVAVDQDALLRFIQSRFGGSESEAALYLEKVFPDYYRIPQLWAYEKFKKRGGDLDPVQRYLNALLQNDECSRIRRYAESIWSIISYSQALKNPRRIKRLVRRLSLINRADWVDNSETFVGVFFLIALSDIWPHAYRAFYYADPDEWKSFINWIVEDDAEVDEGDEEDEATGDDEEANGGSCGNEVEEEISPTALKLRNIAHDDTFADFIVTICQWGADDEEWDHNAYRATLIWRHDQLWKLVDHVRRIGL